MNVIIENSNSKENYLLDVLFPDFVPIERVS